MRAVIRHSGLLLVVATLCGCAAGPRAFMTPLPPSTLDDSVEVQQQLTATFRGETQSMQVALKVVPDKLTLVGLSDIGQRLFTLSWNGHRTQLASAVDGLERLDPARVLTDLQLAYWPLAVLRAHLDADLRLEQHGTARILWHDDKLVWLASSDAPDRWASHMTIYNAPLGYRLDIRPLSVDTTP